VSRPGADAAMAWARQHGEVACVLAVDSGGCPPDGPNLAPDALPPPPAVPSDPRAAACPGVVTEQPPLNGAVAGLGTAPLLAALPPALASFRRVQGGGVAAGTAGHYADGASATYERGEVRLRVSIDDMIRVCTGAAGTGRALLSVEEAQDAQANLQPIAIGSREAVLVQWPGPPERTRVVTWLGDRCKLIVQPDGASPADGLTDLAAAIPLDALEQACRAR